MKKMKFVLCLAMSVSFLAGCGESTPSDWQYTKDDTDKFNVVNSELLQTDNENENILRITNASLLNDEIKDEDFMVFNYEKMRDSEPADDYYSYQIIKANSVKAVKHELSEDGYTIDIYFEGDDEGIYGAIFNKDATFNGDFLFTVPELSALNNAEEKELDKFEKELLESPNPKPDDNNYIDLVSHFGQLCTKIPDEKENVFSAIPGFIVGLISLMISITNFKTTHMQGSNYKNFRQFNELQNRLNSIDKKLNSISSDILTGFSSLLLEADISAIRQYTQNLATFETFHLQPIGNFYRKVEGWFADLLKSIVKNGDVEMELKYTLGDDQKLTRISLFSPEGTPVKATSKGTIHFDKAKKYLDSYDRYDEKFLDYLHEDLLASIQNKEGAFPLPEGITQAKLASDIYETLVENFANNVFADPANKDSMAEFRDLIINYEKQLYGEYTAIVANYVNRCTLSYNFGAEAERSLRNNLAGLLFNLERNASLAQMVCRLSNNFESTLTEDYIYARDCIKAAYQSIKNLPSNYCFRDGQKWDIKLFEFRDNIAGGVYQRRKLFKHSLITYELFPNGLGGEQRVEYNKDAHQWADSFTLKAATARYGAITGRQISMLDYFRQIPGVISPNSNRVIDHYVNLYSQSNVVQFMGKFSDRNAGDPVGKDIRCVAQGDKPNNPIFRVGYDYKYKKDNSRANPDCWFNATYYTADVVVGKGEFIAQKDLIFYCDYIETNKMWYNDEIWSFNGLTRAGIEVFGLGIETTGL